MTLVAIDLRDENTVANNDSTSDNYMYTSVCRNAVRNAVHWRIG